MTTTSRDSSLITYHPSRWVWSGLFCLFVATGLAHAATPAPIPEATGLLVDRVGALSEGANELFSEHEEWRIPFVLFLFSPFALFPMFFARWASVVSALLLAAFFGGAAWALWDSRTAGMIAAGIAFPFPLLWGLNWAAGEKMRGLRTGTSFVLS